MRVLMLAQFYYPVIGGEERHVLALSEALVERGHEVVVATMPHVSRADTEVIRGVTVKGLRGLFQRAPFLFSDPERPHVPPFPDPELLLRLNRIVDEFRPDIVHGHNWLIHSYLPSRLWSDIALVSTLHDHGLVCPIKTLMRRGKKCEGPELGKCIGCAGRHFGRAMGTVVSTTHRVSRHAHRRSVDSFIAVSHAVAEYAELVGGAVPYDVVPTFIPDNVGAIAGEPDHRLAALPAEEFLLFVGELNRNKGLHTLIDAYRRLEHAPPLVLIGRRCPDTPEQLPNNVHLFESWPHAAVMQAWKRCLFGLAPSNWVEPCGTVVMEANAVGKAMIATNHGGFSELVEHGRTGLLVPPNDPVALADAMEKLISDELLCSFLSRNALERAESFKAKSVVPKIEAIYRRARSSRSPLAEGTSTKSVVRGMP
jgi:glycosyltransferase involved in cell wall biosynthesis